MVRTVVCGAADEGSIPSGHPTLSLAAQTGLPWGLGTTGNLRDFTSASHERLMRRAHSSHNGSDDPKNKGEVR